MYLAAFIDLIASLQRILATSIGPFQLRPLGRTLSKSRIFNSCFKTHLFCSNYFTVDYSRYFLVADSGKNSIIGNSLPLTSIKQTNNQGKKVLLFVVLRTVRIELCQYIVHSFCTHFSFHTDRFQLKREISRTMTFCLY